MLTLTVSSLFFLWPSSVRCSVLSRPVSFPAHKPNSPCASSSSIQHSSSGNPCSTVTQACYNLMGSSELQSERELQRTRRIRTKIATRANDEPLAFSPHPRKASISSQQRAGLHHGKLRWCPVRISARGGASAVSRGRNSGRSPGAGR